MGNFIQWAESFRFAIGLSQIGLLSNIQQTGWLKQQMFLTVLEARKCKIRATEDLVFAKGHLLPVSSHGHLFYTGNIPIRENSSLITHSLPNKYNHTED